jgi:predicted secreted hydrolase
MKKILCGLPWLLLVVLLVYVIFVPVRGLITPVQLPADDAFLDQEDVQWWYWTGHLETEEGKRYGFEVVFFSFDSFVIFQDQLTQAAVTDIDGNAFHFEEYVEFGLPNKMEDSFALTAGPGDAVRALGGGSKNRLHSEVDGYVLDLDLTAIDPPVRHYGGDAHPYVFGGFTYYYSVERMSVEGTLAVDGKAHKVKGTAWFDRQYGELYQAISKGWQWFSIQLDDNREIMLFDFLGEHAQVEKSGSLTSADHKTRTLGAHQFQVEQLGTWTSPDTGCTYPSGWRLNVEGLELIVEPLVNNQELRAQHDLWIGPIYWEGASRVYGDAQGQAYVELNGFCKQL